MQKLILGVATAGLLGFGLASLTPALAGPTADQAAAESMTPTTPPPVVTAPGGSSRGEGVIVNGESAGGPADASNGLAQSRIVGGNELRQNAQ